MDLKKLLKPNKIAIVGASEKNNYGGFTTRHFLKSCKKRVDDGDVYFVNSTRYEVFGHKCYPNVLSLPGNIDLVIICTPKASVEGILKEAAEKKCGGAVVYASGYGETGDNGDKQDEMNLKVLCEDKNIALMGPNCGGFVNYVDTIYSIAFVIKERDEIGKVGLVAQSGQVCISLNDSFKSAFSYLISSGNSKIVQIEDYLEFLVDDEDTAVVAAYVEGVTQPEKFTAILKKAALKKKPIVILKAGRSKKGSLVAESHTGSISGSDKSFDAIFDKFGVIRVDDIEEMVSVSSALSVMKNLPKKNAFTALDGSGGETAITADMGSIYGIEFPDFTQSTLDALGEILPSYATPQNPLDGTATICYDVDVYSNTIKIVSSDPNVAATIIGLTLAPNNDDAPATQIMVSGIEKFMNSSEAEKPVFVLPLIESGREQKLIDRLQGAGVPVLPPHKYGFGVLKKILKYAEYVQSVDMRTLEVAVPENKGGKRCALSEHDSKKLLKEFGVPLGREEIAISEEEAVKCALKIGFPVVMKIESADILHKSDANGVKLNVKNVETVKKYYHEILANTKKYKPDAKINGILIQEMLPKGMEVIVGINMDPQFGPMVLLGLGGIFVEIFKDVSLYPAPFNRNEAMMMINSLKSSKMFYGYRGQKELDVDVLADTLVAISEFADAKKNILLEVDINPLFVYEKGGGVVAADGLVILKR